MSLLFRVSYQQLGYLLIRLEYIFQTLDLHSRIMFETHLGDVDYYAFAQTRTSLSCDALTLNVQRVS